MQCEWSECESPETSLMRFGAMHIISLSIMGSKKIQLVFTKMIKETPGNRLIKHTELQWAVFGILIAHVHDHKPQDQNHRVTNT